MPGNYTVTTRAPGTIVTADIYNGDHQVHPNGRNAPGMGSLSNTVAQMQRQTASIVGGNPNLSPSLAGELERLRYECSQLKAIMRGGVAPIAWYEYTNPGLLAIGALLWQSVSDQAVPNTTDTPVDFTGSTVVLNTNTTWAGGSPTKFTAPFTGKYWATCAILFSQFNAGGLRQLQLSVNGSATGRPHQVDTQNSAAHFQYLNLLVPVDLVAGDYIEFIARQSSGSGLFIVGDSNGVATPTQSQYITGGLILIGAT